MDWSWLYVKDRPLFSPVPTVLAIGVHWIIVIVLSCIPTGKDDRSVATSQLIRWTMMPLLVTALIGTNWSWRIGIPLNDAGLGIMTGYYVTRVFELLILYPNQAQRVLPPIELSTPSEASIDSKILLRQPSTSSSSTTELQNGHRTLSHRPSKILEPIPPAFTVARFWHSFDLWTTYRGIGWSFEAPLTRVAYRHPFLRSSSRRDFLLNRLKQLIFVMLITDVYSTILDEEPRTRAFFSASGEVGRLKDQGVAYRALWSVLVVTLVWQSIEFPYLLTSMSCVIVGGLTGWEGALWQPWGWPPNFGTIKELWVHPGLNTVWARTWHAYFRRVLYAVGWVTIGEEILGLPPSSTAPPPSSAPTPNPDGTSSDTSTPLSPTPIPPRTLKQLSSNFLKSLIVFFMTGLFHEMGNLSREPLLRPPSIYHPFTFPIGPTTFFFISQPFAIAVEAFIKSLYRSWKVRIFRGKERGRSWIFLERAVGFACTWIWLGWSAGWVVDDWVNRGFYCEIQSRWSLIRWVWKGALSVPSKGTC